MAERTGIDRATISKLETGKIANPTIGTLRTYAKALGRRLAWTLEEGREKGTSLISTVREAEGKRDVTDIDRS
jgi:transcriptional regulator with XRE-family HTH domain